MRMCESRVYGILNDMRTHVYRCEDGLINLNSHGYTEIRIFGKGYNVKQLNLGYNRLTTLPPQIENFPFLEVLNVRDNELTSLPKEIGNLTFLEKLYLNDNRLTELPKEIHKLVNLRILVLSDNELTFLPDLRCLRYLEELYLFGNPLLEVPYWIKYMNLKHFGFDKN
jgi:Leucine-rich repeat (LRR) protein